MDTPLTDNARTLMALGWDRSRVNDLCRGDTGPNSQRDMAAILAKDVPGTSLRDVRALMQELDVATLSVEEQRAVNRRRPVNQDLLAKRVRALADLGFTKDRIQSLYDDGSSKNDLIMAINAAAGKSVISKSSFATVWQHLGLQERSVEETNRLRMERVNESQRKNYATQSNYGDGYTAAELVDLYHTGLSLQEVAAKTGSNATTISKLVQAAGGEIRMSPSYGELISMLGEKGIGRSEVLSRYINGNLNIPQLARSLGDAIDRRIPNTVLRRMLDAWGIAKPQELVSLSQGAKSRSEFAEAMDRLARCGFPSLESLATHYENTPTLTRARLVRYLNQHLEENEPQFTLRWLGRHMSPMLSADRMRGTSRGEKALGAFLMDIYDDGELVVRDRALIAPYEVDFHLPEESIAIEFNGDYWHGDKFLQANHGMSALEYHQMKTKQCEDAGVTLLHVWECDWDNREDEVQEAIISVLDGGPIPPILAQMVSPTTLG